MVGYGEFEYGVCGIDVLYANVSCWMFVVRMGFYKQSISIQIDKLINTKIEEK